MRNGLGLLATLLLILAGCGRGSAPAPADLPPTEMVYISGIENQAVEEELLQRFAERHPNVTIERQSYGQSPRGYMEEAEPPDVMTISTGFWLLEPLRAGLVADISDVWEQSGLGERYPSSLQALTQRDGKHHFLPLGVGWHAIYYNRAIFEQFDLQPPQTWDELLLIADTLRAGGVTPFAIAGNDEWTASLWFDYLNLRLNGPKFVRMAQQGEASFTDERMRAVFNAWRFLFDRGDFVENPGILNTLNSTAAVIRGDREMPLTGEKAAMVLAAPGMINELPLVFQNELDFFPFPVMNATVPTGELVDTFGLIVPANAPHRAAANAFLLFLTERDTQALLAEYANPELTFIPAHAISDGADLAPVVQQGLGIIQEADELVLPSVGVLPAPVRTALISAMGRFLRTVDDGTVDIDAILTDLETKRLDALQQGSFTD